MKMAIFLKTILAVIIVLCYSMPVHAGPVKTFKKTAPPVKLILTLPNQWLAAEKTSGLMNAATRDSNNEAQAFALKNKPVNVNCNMDVIQNTVGDAPLSNRLFGKCGLHYHY